MSFNNMWDADFNEMINALGGWNLVAPREVQWYPARHVGFPSGQAGAGGTARKNWVPHVDIGEDENHYEMWVDLPGLTKDQINLDIKGNALVVKGKKKYEQLRENLIVRERNMGKFYRVIPLPQDIDPNTVAATYDNGVLHILVPKPTDETRSTRIKIAEGKTVRDQQGELKKHETLPVNRNIHIDSGGTGATSGAGGFGEGLGRSDTNIGGLSPETGTAGLRDTTTTPPTDFGGLSGAGKSDISEKRFDQGATGITGGATK
jgi:HSP20 family protein